MAPACTKKTTTKPPKHRPDIPATRKRSSTTLETSQPSESTKRIRKPSAKAKAPQLALPPALHAPAQSTQLSLLVKAIAEVEGAESGEDEVEEDEFEDIDKIIPPLQFASVWRVVVGKETLPGTDSNVYQEGSISMRQLEAWGDQKLLALKPRSLKAIRWTANASYSGCKASEECPQDITCNQDLYQATKVLALWHKQYPNRTLRLDISLFAVDEVIDLTSKDQQPQLPQQPYLLSQTFSKGRKSATTIQKLALPGVIDSEVATGNYAPEITQRWKCENVSCPNYSFICWSKHNRDLPANHYKVPGEVLRSWSQEMGADLPQSTLEEPSVAIVLKLTRLREVQLRQKHPQQVDQQANQQFGLQSLVSGLILGQLNPFNQLLQQQQQQQQQQSTPPLQPQNLTSSPIRSETDPSEILAQFCDWLKERQGFTKPDQLEQLDLIKIRLLEDDWDLESFYKITDTRWEKYGFKPGTLARIRREMKQFKQQRTTR